MNKIPIIKKKKILFIPADNISVKMSRSHYLAQGLGRYHEVYFLTWKDSRDKTWSGGNNTVFNSFKSFFYSLFRFFKIRKAENLKYILVEAPVMLHNISRKIIGELYSRKIMRAFNKFSLTKIIDKIKPDLVFFADGFFYFPHPDSRVDTYADMQDDFDEKRPEILNYEKKYGTYHFNQTKTNFAVTVGTAERLSKEYEANFEFLPNGANFSQIREIREAEIEELKMNYNIKDKLILSYIGTEAKFNKEFLKLLSERLRENLPQAIILLVGNLPEMKLRNVINMGALSPEKAAVFFRASDAGLILNDTSKTNFLNNSLPLKIVQYSAARKPVLTFSMSWLKENNFPNVFMLNNNIDQWVEKIKNIKSFRWTEETEKLWDEFDWDIICRKLAARLK
jgi:hypothetical protein